MCICTDMHAFLMYTYNIFYLYMKYIFYKREDCIALSTWVYFMGVRWNRFWGNFSFYHEYKYYISSHGENIKFLLVLSIYIMISMISLGT